MRRRLIAALCATLLLVVLVPAQAFAAYSGHWFVSSIAADSGGAKWDTDGVQANLYTYSQSITSVGEWVNSIYDVNADGTNVEVGWFYQPAPDWGLPPCVFMADLKPGNHRWNHNFDNVMTIGNWYQFGIYRDLSPSNYFEASFNNAHLGQFQNEFSTPSYPSFGCERYYSTDPNGGSWTYGSYRNYAAGWVGWSGGVYGNSILRIGSDTTWDNPPYQFWYNHVGGSNRWIYCNPTQM